MGNNAPKGYLKCDGSILNIADYPLLAAHFETEFGTKNNFGGDGTTTFAVPDLQGQFLRGTGVNSDVSQGSGADVGERQKATTIPYIRSYNVAKTTSNIAFLQSDPAKASQGSNFDKTSSSSGNKLSTINTTAETTTISTDPYTYTTRPTNTSVWYCIKY